MIEKLANLIVEKRKTIGIIFFIALICSFMLMPKVNINYDLSEYIPDTEKSKQGMNITAEEFSMQGYARVMVNNVSLVEAKEYKNKIEKIDGVDTVLWLDDKVDIYRPIEFIDEASLNDYYKDGSALYDVMFEEDEYSSRTNKALTEIKNILPEDTNMIGSAVDTKSTQDTIQSEVSSIMTILIPVVIIILLLTTDSYFSPFLFMAVIGMSIFLNMGTNVIFKHVSFITYSIVAALQLAVSMDYSVFMLHTFEAQDKTNLEDAMKKTVLEAITSIISSALTTVMGFLALLFMGFTIGKDMGLVFAKGIVFSLLCVIFFMPYLLLKFYPLIQKSHHKSFLPKFNRTAKIVQKIAFFSITVALLITIPSYVAQKQNMFLYGSAAFGGGEGTRVYEDEKLIVSKFGRSNPIIILVPTGNYISEKEMATEFENLEVVKNVQSLANLVGEGVPDSFVPIDNYQKFRNDKYSRFIIYLRTSSESDLAFESVNLIKEITSKYYGDDYEITGVIPVTMDIKNIVNEDYNRVNMLSIISVMIILLLTFKSWVIPILLIIVIESGIFINMSLPYYSGNSMMFLGYLIVSSIQLGATIDYAILMTNNYLNARFEHEKKDAAEMAIRTSMPAIITSGGILICAAYLIKFRSTINAIAEIGELIGRGAIISVILVTFVLPMILVIFDKIIIKSSFKYIKSIAKRRRDIRKQNREKKKLKREKIKAIAQKRIEKMKEKHEKKLEEIKERHKNNLERNQKKDEKKDKTKIRK